MVMCWALHCKHYNGNETCKFYQFPKEPKLRRKWIKYIRRVDEPGPDAHICSCHFKDGNIANMPVLFLRNSGRLFIFSSPKRGTRKTKRYITTMQVNNGSNVLQKIQSGPSSPGTNVDPNADPVLSLFKVEPEEYVIYKDLPELTR